MKRSLTFHDVRNPFYDQAGKYRLWGPCLTGMMQIILLSTVIWNQETAVYISGFVLIVDPLSVTWLQLLADGYSVKGAGSSFTPGVSEAIFRHRRVGTLQSVSDSCIIKSGYISILGTTQ